MHKIQIPKGTQGYKVKIATPTLSPTTQILSPEAVTSFRRCLIYIIICI